VTPSVSAPALRMPSILITAGGSELPKKWSSRLREVCVQRGVRTIGRATLDLSLDNLAELGSVPFQLHQDVALASDGSTVLKGRIASIEVRNDSRAGTTLRVVVHDDAADLMRTSNAATAENVTYADIVRKLLQAAGARPGTLDLPGTTMPYVLTADSALGVIDEIATRTGRDWVVRDGSLAMWPAASGTVASGRASVTLGELSTFSLNQDAAALKSVTVRGWDVQNKQTSTSTATAAASRGTAVFGTGSEAEITRSVASMNVADTEEAGVVAQALAGTAGRLLARGRGALQPTIEPGVELELKEAGALAGTYYVREVEHRWTASGGSTSFVAGDRDAPTLADPWAGPRRATTHYTGLFVGLVSEVGKEDRLGLVRVVFPTLPGASTDVLSGWARVVMPGAGDQRGMLWLPEVDDEVVVAFTDGDLRRPVVLGALHNGKDTVPAFTSGTVADGKVAARGLRSRLGHTLEFGDGTADGDHYVSLGIAGGKELLRLGKDRGDLKVPSGTPFTITVGSSKVDFDGNGKITVEGTEIVIKATQKLEMSAPEVALKGSAKVDVTSGGPMAVKGATTNVEGSGPLALKGAMVAIN